MPYWDRYNSPTLFKPYQLDVAHHTRALCLVSQRLEQNHERCFNLCLLESYGLAHRLGSSNKPHTTSTTRESDFSSHKKPWLMTHVWETLVSSFIITFSSCGARWTNHHHPTLSFKRQIRRPSSLAGFKSTIISF